MGRGKYLVGMRVVGRPPSLLFGSKRQTVNRRNRGAVGRDVEQFKLKTGCRLFEVSYDIRPGARLEPNLYMPATF